MDSQWLQLVVFKIANEEFGIDILHVQEVNRIMEISKIPKAAEFIKGVINLRGKIIPIVDLRIKFQLKATEPGRYSRILVTEVDNQVIGFLVDSVVEVLRVPSHVMEALPPFVSKVDSTYIKGVSKLEHRVLVILDLSRILLDDELPSYSHLGTNTLGYQSALER